MPAVCPGLCHGRRSAAAPVARAAPAVALLPSEKGVKSVFLRGHREARPQRGTRCFSHSFTFDRVIKIYCRDYFFHLLQNILVLSMCKNKVCPILSHRGAKEWRRGRELILPVCGRQCMSFVPAVNQLGATCCCRILGSACPH